MLEELLVGAGVRLYLGGGQRRPGGIAAGRIADEPGEVADEKDHLVPELLKLTHFVQKHRVPEVQIRRRRVEARLDAQRPPLAQLRQKLGLDEHLARAALDLGKL